MAAPVRRHALQLEQLNSLMLLMWIESLSNLTVHDLIHIFPKKKYTFLFVTPEEKCIFLTLEFYNICYNVCYSSCHCLCMASVYMQRSRCLKTLFKFIIMGYNVTPFPSCDCNDLRITVHTLSHSANVNPYQSEKVQKSECTLTRIQQSNEIWLEVECFRCFVFNGPSFWAIAVKACLTEKACEGTAMQNNKSSMLIVYPRFHLGQRYTHNLKIFLFLVGLQISFVKHSVCF